VPRTRRSGSRLLLRPGEAGLTDEGGEAVVLRGLRDRLVLAASCATDPQASCSAVIVSCAESSAPTCCSTP
jgi:hypothetical protein